MASNGVPILAQALQAHLSRKHQARMWEANQEQENEARALQQANQQQQWGRQDKFRQEDMARALEDREMRRAMEQQGMAREDQRWSADKEMQRARMQQEKELAAARIEADKLGREYEWNKREGIARDAEKGRDTRHNTPRPASPGRPKSSADKGPPRDHLTEKRLGLLTSEQNNLRSNLARLEMVPNWQAQPELVARKEAWTNRLDALQREYTALVTAPQAPAKDKPGTTPPPDATPPPEDEDY